MQKREYPHLDKILAELAKDDFREKIGQSLSLYDDDGRDVVNLQICVHSIGPNGCHVFSFSYGYKDEIEHSARHFADHMAALAMGGIGLDSMLKPFRE